jgi:serine/threonine protein phosphatase PrpC
MEAGSCAPIVRPNPPPHRPSSDPFPFRLLLLLPPLPPAGTTVTVCIVIGDLVTVANVGDSAAVLDTGCSMLELTDSHRIQTHDAERSRLKAAGCLIAQLGFHLEGPAKPGDPGVGPLRIWPGGLCVSRSVGDVDAGPEIVPVPHVKQFVIPNNGCRIILASDGLWDVMTLSKAVKMVRSKPTESATQVR